VSAWREVADKLAAAMTHSEKGVCTLTAAEHEALAAYRQQRQEGGPRHFGEQIVTKGGLPKDLERRLAQIDEDWGR
jgi:hypothetical protein